MRLLFLTLLAVLLLPFATSRADEKTERFMQIVEEASENQKLYNKTVTTCLKELESKTHLFTGDPDQVLQDCISSKGIKLFLDPVYDQRTPSYHMGRGNDGAKVLTYQIPERDMLIQRLQGKTAAPESTVRPETAAQHNAQTGKNTSEPARTTPADDENAQKSSSTRPKIYLPSKDSGEGPKPIFLKR